MREELILVRRFKALGDKTRLKVFKILLKKRDICVTEIAGILNISIPAVSQHLKVLEKAQLAERERRGHKICYKVKRVDSLVKYLINLYGIGALGY